MTSTDSLDHITATERSALVGYCEFEEEWMKFSSNDGIKCPNCGRKFSSQVGQQITTQRSFDPVRMKVKKRKKQ